MSATLHRTAWKRAKTCARAVGGGLPERVSASREAVARGRARAGAFCPLRPPPRLEVPHFFGHENSHAPVNKG